MIEFFMRRVVEAAGVACPEPVEGNPSYTA